MIAYRSALAGSDAQAWQSSARRLDGLLEEAQHELETTANDSTATFIGALTILLREGLEALLIVVGMLAFLKKTERSDAIRSVHFGWTMALIAGGLTWAAATYLVDISGASREITEGLSSIFAAVVLLSVGLWMHQKSSADRWQAYLREKLSDAMSRRTNWALFGLAFIAVYREVFETVLFYSALTSEGSGQAVAAGFVVGLIALAIITWALLRTSARMPIGKFFAVSSILVAVLAVVLAGKGVAALQEAGWMNVTAMAIPRIEVFGLYPTAETAIAQVIVIAIAFAGVVLNARRSRSK